MVGAAREFILATWGLVWMETIAVGVERVPTPFSMRLRAGAVATNV